LAWNILKDLGLTRLVIKINSLGCSHCRPDIKNLLTNYFEKRKVLLCADCQERLKNNPLRILDCKRPSCREIMTDAPALVDNLCENCRDEFKQVLEYLDEAQVSYDLDPHLVRGLDYYTKTTFEIVNTSDLGAQTSLAGGGRYDGLIELYGGRPTPAIGFSFGVERVISQLKKQKVKIREEVKARVFVVQLGEMAKKQALGILSQLQKVNIPTRAALSKSSIKSQLKMADKLGVDFTLIIGQKEAMDRTIIIRDMSEGVQEILDQEDLVEKIKDKLKKK
jgi:histidyl-tRNA synthetase